jgi:inner membrane protein
MASAFSHAFLSLALGNASHHSVMTWPVLFLGMACSILPDADVIGFSFGIRYGDLWGHRGMTHSFFFAGLLSALLVTMGFRQRSPTTKAGLFLYLFLCTASHGVLDALTDGGLGVAFFSPFDTTRYFFPIRPVAVSPIGIGEFFSIDALRILASEITWIWLPTTGIFLILRGVHYIWGSQLSRNGHE